MRPFMLMASVLTVSIAACAEERPPATDSPAVVQVPESSSAAAESPYVFVTEVGIGDLRADMTLAQAQGIAPDLRLIAGTDSTECSYLEWPSAPAGVLVMFDEGRLARFDVDSAGVRTQAGAQVGDRAARLDSLYAGRLTRQPHHYTDGQYFVVTPLRAADSLFRLIFEVENGTVSRYRVGRMPQVEYVEGCS